MSAERNRQCSAYRCSRTAKPKYQTCGSKKCIQQTIEQALGEAKR